MQLIRARRLIAGVAVASAVLAAAPAPASAAPEAADISMYLPDVTLPVGAQAGTPLSPILWATDDVVLQDATVTYELVGGLGGVTLYGEEDFGHCENVSPTKVVCADPFPLELGPDGMAGGFWAYAEAGDDAVVGESGTIRATLSADGITPVTHDARVRAAESVDLTAGPEVRATAAPGASFDAPLVVSNTGDKAITGAAVLFDHDFSLESTTRYRNCLYVGDELASCTFDQTLEVGKTYSAAMPLKVRADTIAPGDASAFRGWLTPAELEDFYSYLESQDISPGTPGTGDVLTLTERPAARAVQSDPNPEDNWGSVEVRVTGKNGVDLAAVGAELTAAAGDEITVPVGARSVGKATLDFSRVGGPAAVTMVTMPAGTTVLDASEECYPVVRGEVDFDAPGKPGAAKYWCDSDYIFVAGAEEIYEFKLRVDRIDGRTAGTVTVNEPCECERFRGDINKSNDKASIVITSGAAGGGGGDGSGDGGGLPVTGPAGTTLAAVGAALLVLGAAGVFLARRRRDTFVS